MRVYIAGRITGLPYEGVKVKFEKAEAACRFNNWSPFNPVKHVNQKASHEDAMKILLPHLLDCHAILLLDDYAQSEGAQIEASLARYVGKTIIYQDDLEQ